MNKELVFIIQHLRKVKNPSYKDYKDFIGINSMCNSISPACGASSETCKCCPFGGAPNNYTDLFNQIRL